MKKKFNLSVAVAALLAGNVFAGGGMELAGGKLTGDIRAAYHGHANAESDDKSQESHSVSATGLGLNPTFAIEAVPSLSIEVGAGVAVPVTESDDAVAAHDFTFGKENDDGDASETYAVLNRYNIAYDFGSGSVKAGAQDLDTPFVGADDVRLVPNTFTAVVANYTGVKNLTLTAAQIISMAGAVDSGAFDNEQYNSMSDAVLAGLTYDDDSDPATPEVAAFADNDDVNDNGVTVLSAVYANEEAGANGQIWYYSMPETDVTVGGNFDMTIDAITAIYADAGMKFGVVDAAVQYISQDIGGDKATAIGAKADISATDAIGVTVAYNTYSSDDASAPAYYAWGGYPEYVAGEEVDASSKADWDGGSASMIGVSYSGIEHLDLSATYLAYSDVATVLDIVVGYGINEHTHISAVYETVDNESDSEGDETVTKAHLSYHF